MTNTSLNIILNDPGLSGLREVYHISAGESHVNTDENQCFPSFKLPQIYDENTILQFIQPHFKIQK